MATQFMEKGHANPTSEASPSDRLNELAKAHATANGVTFHAAYDQILKTDIGSQLLRQMRYETN
jgi:hypothetical protein